MDPDQLVLVNSFLIRSGESLDLMLPDLGLSLAEADLLRRKNLLLLGFGQSEGRARERFVRILLVRWVVELKAAISESAAFGPKLPPLPELLAWLDDAPGGVEAVKIVVASSTHDPRGLSRSPLLAYLDQALSIREARDDR